MKQALELAMVLALEPRLILLDEPTAGLTKAERATIGVVLKRLTAEAGFASSSSSTTSISCAKSRRGSWSFIRGASCSTAA